MILFLGPILLFLVLLRGRWITWHVDQYKAASLYWAFRTQQSPDVLHEMSQLWPVSHILWAFWIWDFRRFVVHQDLYDTAMQFALKESLRNDRGWDMFDKKPLDKTPEDDTHGPN